MERIVYRNANIVGYGKGYSLELVDGRVTGITPTDKMPAEGVDLKGRLIAPRFVDSHMHLDKAMVPAAAGAKGLLAAIAAFAEYLQQCHRTACWRTSPAAAGRWSTWRSPPARAVSRRTC